MNEVSTRQCAGCNRIFATVAYLKMHLRYCVDSYNPYENQERPVESASYRSLLEKAAQSDPAYSRYAGRVDISEPNGMSDFWRRHHKSIKQGS